MCPAFSSLLSYFMLFTQHNDVLQHLRQATIYEISEIFGLFTWFIDISKGLLSDLLSSNQLLQSWSLQPQRSVFQGKGCFPHPQAVRWPHSIPQYKRNKNKRNILGMQDPWTSSCRNMTEKEKRKMCIPLSNTEMVLNIPNYFPQRLQLDTRTTMKLHWVW